MKNLLLSLIVTGSCLSLVHGEDKPQEVRKLASWEKEFLSLPEDRRQDFAKELNEARGLFNQKRIFETLEVLRKAADIFPESPEVANIRGACMVEFRDFDKALDYFEKANGMSPNNSSVLFNIGEIYFVTKKWNKAAETFDDVLKSIENEPGVVQIRRLCEFKKLLSYIKLDRIEEARQMASLHDDVLEDTPYPYYAKAAILFHDDKKAEAQIELLRARRIFQRDDLVAPWHDTLMEFGYVPSFYGGETVDIQE